MSALYHASPVCGQDQVGPSVRPPTEAASHAIENHISPAIVAKLAANTAPVFSSSQNIDAAIQSIAAIPTTDKQTAKMLLIFGFMSLTAISRHPIPQIRTVASNLGGSLGRYCDSNPASRNASSAISA